MDSAVGLSAGLPVKAYTADDPQSCKASEQRFNPKFFCTNFADCGHNVWIFMNDLLLGPWLASDLYNVTELVKNSMTGYYWYLINLSHVEQVYGAAWEQRALPLVTTRTLLTQAGHLIPRTVYWPEHVPFRPKKQTELGCELHNSAKKTTFKGMPCQRDGLLATQNDHIRQYSQLPDSWPVNKDYLITPLSEDTLVELSKESYVEACRLQAWFSLNAKPSEISQSFQKWYAARGRTVVEDPNAFLEHDCAEEEEADLVPDLAEHEQALIELGLSVEVGDDIEWDVSGPSDQEELTGDTSITHVDTHPCI